VTQPGLSESAIELLFRLVGNGPTDGPIVTDNGGITPVDPDVWNELVEHGYAEAISSSTSRVIRRATFQGKKEVARWNDLKGKGQ
jgi:hypothetical protein